MICSAHRGTGRPAPGPGDPLRSVLCRVRSFAKGISEMQIGGLPARAAGILYLIATVSIAGCGGSFAPRPLEQVPFMERAQTQVIDGVSVTVAVPTREEIIEIYGVDLSEHGMQAVWVEVDNTEDKTYWFLLTGLDSAYYGPGEAAYAFKRTLSTEDYQAFERHVASLQFGNPVLPGEAVSGFVIVNRDEAFKAVDVDLVAREKALSFTYIVRDPTFRGDFTEIDFKTIYRPDELVLLEDYESLRSALESLPCCTTNADASADGDPMNLVLVGNAQDVFPALIRRGWHPTEIIWSEAVKKTVRSFLSGHRYRYSPVSPLYVYGRKQDLAAQKARGTVHERNHLRIWLSPLRFRGKPVWVGQISRDIGVKFTLKSPTISTHVIDPEVDEARSYLIEDLSYSQALSQIGFVYGVGRTDRADPRFNLVGDPFFSDGRRAVLFFEPRPRSLGDLDVVDVWLPIAPTGTSSEEASGGS